MEIYRSGATNPHFYLTDSKDLAEWADGSDVSKMLILDGTYDKASTKHTQIGVKFDPDDLSALSQVFVKQLKQEMTKANMLRDVMERIISLIDRESEAPSQDALIATIRSIALKYSWPWDDVTSSPPEISWVKWSELGR